MREGARKHKELHEEEQDKTLTFRAGNTSLGEDRIEVRSEHKDAKDDLVRDFDDNVCNEESGP